MDTTKTEHTKRYDFAEVEPRWQKHWQESGLFKAPDLPDSQREKFYMLVMFAYPSGDIHMGHFRNYIIGDAVARRQMMLGKQVMHPFGWDAFGLPAEQAAIKRKLNPADWTKDNIKISRETLQKVGISFDWSREVTTCLPDYYRWSQWIFLKLFEKGLAYRKDGLVNWCPGCLTVLANEQVVSGQCERCDSVVEKTKLEQWYFKITDYADRLLDNLDKLTGWPDAVKSMQRDWIGRSYGAEVEFAVEGTDWTIPVFTTRIDTIFGVSFLALAPESDWVEKLQLEGKTASAVKSYREEALRKTEIERGGDTDDKTGVFTGKYIINPFTGEKLQIWVADYVLAQYGSGAVMGVPGNDSRDRVFATKYNLPIVNIVRRADGKDIQPGEIVSIADGTAINSGDYTDLPSAEAIEKMVEFGEKSSFAKKQKQFKLRDWLISRQRYWGTPIPIIHCGKCGMVPVNESDLPVVLPEVTDFTPKGRSPLADVPEFMNVTCPKCGEEAQRDPDTMDTFICSSWYHLRYADPNNNSAAFDSAKVNSWLPIDKYIGGITHATGHLMYFRFITMFLHDLGLIDCEEPVTELFNHGMVSDSTGAVMSKSKGNVVSPIALMKERGVDVTRLAMFFTAPSEREVLWSNSTVVGVEKFLLNKVLQLSDYFDAGPSDLKYHFKRSELDQPGWELYLSLNKYIKRASEDSVKLQFNTVIAGAMELCRDLERTDSTNAELKNLVVVTVLKILAPLAPHMTEEIWRSLGFSNSIFKASWPEHDPEALLGDLVTMAVQVNGRVRGEIQLAPDANSDTALSLARSNEKVASHLEGKEIIKEIYVPSRILNIVVK